MDKRTRRFIGLLILGAFLIGGLLAGVYVVQRGYSVMPGALGEMELGDTCFFMCLPMIEQAIKDYQLEHEGKNPEELTGLYQRYGLGWMRCKYVYRGADLTSEAPAELILVYDQAGNHLGYRNILWARGAVDFLVDETEVTRAEYRTECVTALMSREMADLDIRLDEANYLQVDANGRYLVYNRQVDAEEYRKIFNQLLLGYKSGPVAEERLGIWVKNVQNDWWERKAWVRRSHLVQRVSEAEFAGLIERDNEIRRQLGLAEKK